MVGESRFQFQRLLGLIQDHNLRGRFDEVCLRGFATLREPANPVFESSGFRQVGAGSLNQLAHQKHVIITCGHGPFQIAF